jgi:DNA-binding MarR family transcriptional regulator
MKLDFSQTYLYKLHRLTNTLDKVFDQTLLTYAGISLSQFTLLLAVTQGTFENQRKVAAYLELSPGAVSRQVEIAHQKGWIDTSDSADDRRNQILNITPAGRLMILKAKRVLEKRLLYIFDDHDIKLSLMEHINLLFKRIKEVPSD